MVVVPHGATCETAVRDRRWMTHESYRRGLRSVRWRRSCLSPSRRAGRGLRRYGRCRGAGDKQAKPLPDTAYRSQLGIAGTPVTGAFTLTAGPITIKGTDSAQAVIEQEGNIFVGDFTPGDFVLETKFYGGLLSLHFSTGVSHAGIQFQGSDMNFPNNAFVVARDINHNILASYVVSTANHGKQDGSAPYIGVKDLTGPNIYYLEYSYGFDTPWAVNEISVSVDAPLPIQSNAQLGSCLPSSSIGVLVQPPNVAAYVPQRSWFFGSAADGVHFVPIEGAGVGTVTNVVGLVNKPVNSCASNSVTGQTVCVGNNTDIYLITNKTLNSILKSSADQLLPFYSSSTGCMNCGVVFDSVNNRVVIEVGLKGSPSGSGIQELLAPNTIPFFSAAVAFNHQISENIQNDPFHSLLLSPGHTNFYDIIENHFFFQYSQQLATPGFPPYTPGLDSAAEDCTTEMALSSVENSADLGSFQRQSGRRPRPSDEQQALRLRPKGSARGRQVLAWKPRRSPGQHVRSGCQKKPRSSCA